MTLIVIFTSCYLVPTNVSANGLIVHGSSALKGSVIGAMERSGIKFADETAKDKAFQRWNVKAYEKWKSDEQLGKNADLWEQFNSIKASSPTVNVIDELPGFGKVLLDASFFGMAVAIGAEVGTEIRDAQLNKTRLEYATMDYPVDNQGINLAPTLGYTQNWVMDDSGWYNLRTYNKQGGTVANAVSPWENDGSVFWNVTGIEKNDIYGTFKITYQFNGRSWNGELRPIEINTFTLEPGEADLSNGYRYTSIPTPQEVPNINIPEVLNPVVSVPDLAEVPEMMPDLEPVPVIVPISAPVGSPSSPTVNPFADNPHNTPYHGKESAPGGETPPKEPGGDGEQPKDPELPPKEPVGTNPFKNLIPIAMLLALLDLLVAILLYLVRMFDFILKLPLVTPKPIPFEAFIWFKNVTWLGIKPYSLTMTLATFFVGFMAFKSIRRLFP